MYFGKHVLIYQTTQRYIPQDPRDKLISQTEDGKFYVLFTVNFDITQQLNQQMHFSAFVGLIVERTVRLPRCLSSNLEDV